MIKNLHMLTAFVSIIFFITRFIWVIQDSQMMTKKWVKIVPHINDTILLLAALYLAFSIEQYPFVHSWLTAKFVVLLLYIVLGTFALKRAKTKQWKSIFFVMALISFGYIVMVALTRTTGLF